MKKKIIYLFIFLLSVILQISVFGVLFDGILAADVVLMLILAWSVIDGFSAFLGWAIFFGVLFDFFNYDRVGVHALIFLATVYFVSFFSRRFSVELKGMGLIFFLFFIVVISLFSHIVTAWGVTLGMGAFDNIWKLLNPGKIFFIQLIYNTFLFFMWFVLIKKSKELFALDA